MVYDRRDHGHATFAVFLSAKFTCIFSLCVRYGHLNTYLYYFSPYFSIFFFCSLSLSFFCRVGSLSACERVCVCARTPHKVAASERAWSLIIWYLGAFVVDTIGMRFSCSSPQVLRAQPDAVMLSAYIACYIYCKYREIYTHCRHTACVHWAAVLWYLCAISWPRICMIQCFFTGRRP